MIGVSQARSDLAIALRPPGRPGEIPPAIRAEIFHEVTALQLLRERMGDTLARIEALASPGREARRIAISLSEVRQSVEGAARMLWSDLKELR